MIYAGIGSRETPRDICKLFETIGEELANRKVLLRSGGAQGADEAFETGCKRVNGYRDIYLPWAKFRNNDSMLYDVTSEAMELAEKFHPAWDKLADSGRLLMGRNSHILFGDELIRPVDFIICWTNEGLTVGGTGQCLRMAESFYIPIFNLGRDDDINQLWNRIDLLSMFR
jgi:hypothetical protein